MIRALLVLLVLANVAHWAWTQGHLLPLGGSSSWANPDPRRSPLRLERQLRPELITVVRQPPSPAAD